MIGPLSTTAQEPPARTREPASDHPSALSAGDLTHVQLTWIEKREEQWIRFGAPVAERILDRPRRVLSFRPGCVFAVLRWSANDFGTTFSRLDVVASVAPGQAFQTVPCIDPGAEILLTMTGWPRVARVLETIDAIERLGIDLESVSPEHWRHVHNRMAAGQAPRTYTLGQHRAFLLRRRVTS